MDRRRHGTCRWPGWVALAEAAAEIHEQRRKILLKILNVRNLTNQEAAELLTIEGCLSLHDTLKPPCGCAEKHTGGCPKSPTDPRLTAPHCARGEVG